MTVLRYVLLAIHLIALLGVLFGLLRQVRASQKVIDAIVLHSISTQLVSGLLLVGVLEGLEPGEVNHGKIAVKLVVALVLAVLAWANRRKPAIPDGLFWGFLGLELVNVVIAYTL